MIYRYTTSRTHFWVFGRWWVMDDVCDDDGVVDSTIPRSSLLLLIAAVALTTNLALGVEYMWRRLRVSDRCQDDDLPLPHVPLARGVTRRSVVKSSHATPPRVDATRSIRRTTTTEMRAVAAVSDWSVAVTTFSRAGWARQSSSARRRRRWRMEIGAGCDGHTAESTPSLRPPAGAIAVCVHGVAQSCIRRETVSLFLHVRVCLCVRFRVSST